MRVKELFGADLRSLALFRMALAALILTDLFLRVPALKDFYTDQSIFPRSLALWFSQPWDISLYLINGTLLVQIILFLITAFSALLLFVGYRTRWVTLASWFLIVSLQRRNTLYPNGGNVLLLLLLFWSLFLPLGSRYSLDSILNSSPDQPPKRIFSMGTIALFAQVIFVYWFAGFFKILTPEWRNGTAIYYALSLEQYAKPFSYWLLGFQELLKFLTYTILAYEFLGPLLLFSPVAFVPIRLAAIAGFFFFQLGLGLGIELQLFPWVSTAAMLPFIPTACWDRLEEFWTKRVNPSIGPACQGVYEKLRSVFTPKPLKWRTSLGINIFATLCLLFVLASNGAYLSYRFTPHPFLISEKIRWFGGLLGLEQSWPLYAPPGDQVYWFVIPGKLKDGSEVDLLRKGKPLSWETPTRPATAYPNYHWLTYLRTLLNDSYTQTLSPYLGWHLCNEWNKKALPERRLMELEIVCMWRKVVPPENRKFSPRYQKFSKFKYTCP